MALFQERLGEDDRGGEPLGLFDDDGLDKEARLAPGATKGGSSRIPLTLPPVVADRST